VLVKPPLEEFSDLRERLQDDTLKWLCYAAVPALLLSLSRAWAIGWKPVMSLQVLLVAALWLTWFYRQRIARTIRISVMLTITALAGFAGLVQFGLASQSVGYLIFMPFIAILFLDAQVIWWLIAGEVLIFTLIATAACMEWLQYSLDYEAFIHFPLSWATVIWVTMAFAVILALIARRMVQELLQREAAIKEREENYRELVENVNAIILRMARDGTVTYFNEYAEHFFGYSSEEILGRNVVGTIVPPIESGTGRDLSELIGQILANPEQYEHNDNENMTRDGRRVMIRWANKVIFDEHGRSSGVLSIGSDITLQKQAEQDLIEAKALAERTTQMKSEFLANMSHEIRTPMNGIIGLSQLAMNQDMSNEVRDYVEKISYSSQSLLGILNDILDFSKLEAGKVIIEHTLVDLDTMLDTLRDLFEELAHTKKIGFSFHVAAGTPRELVGDPLRLQQILSNLISNAIKFTEQGEVKLSISSSPAEDHRVSMRFVLSDTGIGMSEETISGLFQPFSQADSSTTRKFGGTGLGLAISMKLLNLMGGNFEVDSKPGKGTKFRFDLLMGVEEGQQTNERRRRKANAPGVLKQQLQASAKSLQGTSVLVVEDNNINQVVVSQFLKLSGMDVTLANNGQEALEKLQTQDFDVVLMDLHMPVMDGIEATKLIKANPRYADLPIIALTADVVEEERQHCLDIGMVDFVTKPINPYTLIATVTLSTR